MSNYVRSMLFGVVLLVGLGSARAGIEGTWRYQGYEVDTMLHWSTVFSGSGALNGTMNYEAVESDGDTDSGTIPMATVFHPRGGVTIDAGQGQEIWNVYRNLAEDVICGVEDNEDDALVTMNLLVQPATNHSAEDLLGRWHLRRLLFVPGAPAFVGYGKAEGSLRGTMTSRWEYSPVETAEKELVVSSTITPVGVVSLTVRVPKTGGGGALEDFSYTGYMNASRDVIISTSAPNDAEENCNLLVLVKQAEAYSRADLAGTWAMVQMWIGPDGMDDDGEVPEYAGYTRGLGALNGRFNVEDGSVAHLGWSRERTVVGLRSFVAADGQVKIMPMDGGVPLSGQMNASKNVIVCADNSEEDVTFTLFVKATSEAFSGFSFAIADGKATVTGYDGIGVAVVPATYNGMPVTAIADGVFADNPWLFNVVMPASIAHIGAGAFRGCAGLEWLAMPAGLESIGAGAFTGCENLEDLYFRGGRPEVQGLLGSSAVAYYAQGNTGWDGGGDMLGGLVVTRIDYAPESEFESYQVPGGRVISRYTGQGALVNVPPTIHDQYVVCINDYAFADNGNVRLLVLPENLVEIRAGAISSCDLLRTVFLPSSLRWLGDHAFEDNESLLFVAIPEGAVQLAREVFMECTQLAAVGLPSTLQSIGAYAFASCIGLGSVHIPALVSDIGEGAFVGCCGLERFTVAAGNAWYSHTTDGLLCDKEGTRILSYPAGRPGPYILPAAVTTIDPYAFYASGLDSIAIPSSVMEIGEGAFGACGNLAAITVAEANDQFSSTGGVLFSKDGRALLQYPGGLAGAYTVPASVDTIAAFAFAGCWRLSGIGLAANVQTIGEGAFSECMALREVALPAGLQRIEESTFDSCHSLQNVAVPDGVTFIGESAFEDCYSLRQIVIPEGVLSIGGDAFGNCVQLQSMVVPGSVTELGEGAFAECRSLATAVLGSGVTVIPYDCFYGCSSLREVTIRGPLTEIGEYAFIYCQSLPNFVVPATVTKIDTFAFWDCPSLVSIEFLGAAPQIGWRPFPINPSTRLYYWVNQPGWDALAGSWDAYANQLEGRVRTFRVLFDTGGAGLRTGGGELEQNVAEGQQVDFPVITPVGADWTFLGWDPFPAIPIHAETVFRAQYRYVYQLSAGWNLISPTLLPLPELAQQIVDWGLTGYDRVGRHYAQSAGVEVGQAYWVFIAADNGANIVGFGPGSDGLSAPMSSGWHFVGPALPMVQQPAFEVAWEWTGRSYRLAKVLVPGRGYWLYQSQQ